MLVAETLQKLSRLLVMQAHGAEPVAEEVCEFLACRSCGLLSNKQRHPVG